MATRAKKLPSGNWRVNLYIGTDPDGKKKYKSFTAPTKKEAEYQAAEYALTRKEKRKPQALTVGEAIDRYIDNKTAVLSPATIYGYRKQRRNMLQSLMNIRLESLSNETIQKAINRDAAHLAPKTVSNAYGLLAAALKEYAPDMNIAVKLPARVKPDIKIPTKQEIDVMLKLALDKGDHALYVAILLGSQMGMRRSEICALTPSDIKNGYISITKAMVQDDQKKWIIKSTKTYAGKRTLQATAAVISALSDVKPADNGTLLGLTPDIISHRFGNLPSVCRFHDLRHYYASVMLALGIPDKYAMERMGHASTGMLKAVYQHTMQDKQREVAETINAFFNT